MDIAISPNMCVVCNTEKQSLLVCDVCHGVAYCSISCQNKDFRKHRQICVKIKKLRENLQDHSEDVIEFWDASASLSVLYGQMCQKRMSRLAVEQLLKWKQKVLVFAGFSLEHNTMADPEDIPIVINCLTALGRYQEALDFAAHWRKGDELLKMEKYQLLVNHFKKWMCGDYEREDITQELDKFVGIRSEESDCEDLNISYSLVIIKLFVIAVMENHLRKREGFLTFMQGTHPRLGDQSHVIRLAGMTPAVRLIAKYCNITTKPLDIPSCKISHSSLSRNKSHLNRLLEKIHSLNPHALFSMIGDYSLRKLDFQSEEDFLAKPAVQASWSAGTWSRVILEKLQDKEKEMLVGVARNIIKGSETF